MRGEEEVEEEEEEEVEVEGREDKAGILLLAVLWVSM